MSMQNAALRKKQDITQLIYFGYSENRRLQVWVLVFLCS